MRRYLVAIACVVAAAAVRIVLNPLWGLNLPFFTFFPAVIAAAWYGGFGPGVVASVLAALTVDFFWLHPINALGVSAPAEILAVVLFVVVGIAVSILSELLHRSRRRLNAAQRERLRAAQDRLALLDSIGQPIFGVDLDGRCIFANRSCAALLRRAPAELIGQDMREVVPHDLAGRSPSPTEEVVRRPDGTSFTAECWAHPIVVAERVTGTVVALTDLTERRRAEQEHREITARERLAVEIARLGVWEYDVVTDSTTWSERAQAVLGATAGATSRAEFLSLIDAQDRRRVETAMAEALTLTDAGEYEIEYRVRPPGAETRWVAARVTTLRDEASRPLRLIGTMMDVTERKRTEEELRRLLEAEQAEREHAETSAATLRKLQIVTDHALSHLGLDQLLPELMRRIREVLACDTATVLLWDEQRGGLRPVESDGLREEIVEDVCIPLGTGVAGRIAEAEVGLIVDEVSLVDDLVSPFLRKHVHSLIGVPLRTGSQLIGVLHVGAATPRLFTEADLDLLRRVGDRVALAIDRARLADRERRARDEAEQANRSKDEFLAVLSHELRTPLTAVLGWVKLLRTGRVTQAQVDRALETIERNTRLQARLIDDLLDLSRAITGKLALDQRPVAFAPIVQDAVESFATAAVDKGLKLTVTTDPVTVRGDALRLAQVVTNVVGNAVKFTPAGGDISVRLARVGTEARLTVHDTGVGIDPDLLPHIFDRFRQADASGNPRHAGLGLGLAVVRHLVDLHGGSVRAESAGPGRGTTLTVTLPLLTDGAVGEVASEAAEGADPLRLNGARVLLVDDDADSLELLATVLRQHGAEVTAVSDVDAALDGLTMTRFDVLISDLSMPGRSGFDLIREVRQALPPPVSRLPAVAVTALTRPEDRQRALGAGFDAFLTKPVDPAAFVRLAVSMTATGDAA